MMQMTESQSPATGATDGVHANVLIVDDDPRAREVIELLLYPDEYHLWIAGDGQQALRLIECATPDLVLLDVMLPGADGFEVCRRMRATPSCAEVPIIMITALNDRQSRLQGFDAGADDFISKPFDRLELRTRVRSITRLNRYQRLLAERQRLSWLLDTSNTAYITTDRAGEMTYANAQARRYLNLPYDNDQSTLAAR